MARFSTSTRSGFFVGVCSTGGAVAVEAALARGAGSGGGGGGGGGAISASPPQAKNASARAQEPVTILLVRLRRTTAFSIPSTLQWGRSPRRGAGGLVEPPSLPEASSPRYSARRGVHAARSGFAGEPDVFASTRSIQRATTGRSATMAPPSGVPRMQWS